jgi:hypothetical protein
MEKELAIDIVLLFSEKVTHKLIELNHKLKKEEKEIELNEKNCFAHLSLSMLGVKEKDLDDLKKELSKLLQKQKKFNLELKELTFDSIGSEKMWANLRVENNSYLQNLHKEIMKLTKQFNKLEFHKKMFCNPEEINLLTLQWAQGYEEKSSFDNFSPHISLGVGEFESEVLNLETQVEKVAICQLGSYCTCRKILFELSF